MAAPSHRPAPGRLPERVYWFRRAVVLAGLAFVIAFLMWVVSLLSGSTTATPATKAAPVTTPSPAVSGQATAFPQVSDTGVAPAPSAAPSSAQPSAPPSSAAPTASSAAPSTASSRPALDPCDPSALTLGITGTGKVPVGATADITVTVTNSGASACAFTFDSRFTLKIVSGTDQIWTTGDCGQWAPTGSQNLDPGAAITWRTTWDRHRSSGTCSAVQATLKAGTYVANAMYTGAQTAQMVMNLTS